MRFVHLSDLHLGKNLRELSLLEDQKHILSQILEIIDQECPDAVLIAGDVYNQSVPNADSMTLLNDFLVQLSKRKLSVFLISGNHDSPERLAFARELIELGKVHIAPVYKGTIDPIIANDKYGKINIFLLPFVKPSHVQRYFPEEQIESFNTAVKKVIQEMKIDPEERNILVTHQFVNGAKPSESEESIVGGINDIEGCIFDDFDYVALGHLHNPQNCSSEKIRYCGTPLKYSFSEVNSTKSVTVVDLNEKGSLIVRTVDLVPLHEMHVIQGSFSELTNPEYYTKTTYQDDYLHIILTDKDSIPDAFAKLRLIYRNLLKMNYENERTRNTQSINGAVDVANRTPLDIFCDFYKERNIDTISEPEIKFIKDLLEILIGGENETC